MKTLEVYLKTGTVKFEEGQNCERILDRSDDYPVVRVFLKEKVLIFKGVPYMITTDKNDRFGGQP